MLEKERFHALQILAEYLLGSGARVSFLVTMVDAEQLPNPQKSEITKNCCGIMVLMCKFQGWEIPQQFSLNRVNSPAVLLHWRISAILVSKLTEEQRELFLNLPFYSNESQEKEFSDSLPVEYMESCPLPMSCVASQEIGHGGITPLEHMEYMGDNKVLNIPLVSPECMETGMGLPIVDTNLPVTNMGASMSTLCKPTEICPSVAESQERIEMGLSIVLTNLPAVKMGVSVSTLCKPTKIYPSVVENKERSETPRYLAAIDSHFHLDKTRIKLFGRHSTMGPFELIFRTPPYYPKVKVEVIGGVAVFATQIHFRTINHHQTCGRLQRVFIPDMLLRLQEAISGD